MKKYKYPRTLHLPFSEGRTSDDKSLKDSSIFFNKEVVVTEKMDGENATLYKNFYHARSLNYNFHESRSWIISFHSKISHLIEDNYRICGENLFAKHSIHYEDLESYFYGFSVWNDNLCLSWDGSVSYMENLGITVVPVLYRGIYDEDLIKGLYESNQGIEGFVVRNVESFLYEDFSSNVGKFVRKDHVQTDKHWMHSKIIKNGLKS